MGIVVFCVPCCLLRVSCFLLCWRTTTLTCLLCGVRCVVCAVRCFSMGCGCPGVCATFTQGSSPLSLTVTTAAGYGNVAAMAPPAAMLSSVSSTLYDAMPTAAPCTLTFVSSPVLPAINASYTLTCGSQVYAGVLFLGNTYTYVYPNPISGNGGVGSSFFINQYVL